MLRALLFTLGINMLMHGSVIGQIAHEEEIVEQLNRRGLLVVFVQ